MKNPIILEMLAHWEKLRNGRIAPRRSEIDPGQIENALEYAFILERPDTGCIRFRIAGMRLSELMGMDLRAMPATSVITPENRTKYRDVLNRLFAAPEIVELLLRSPRGLAAPIHGQMLLLPMATDDGTISRILGCLVTDCVNPTPPHRFTITKRKITRIIASGPPQPEAHQPLHGFAEPADTFIPASPLAGRRRVRGKPHLRLVKSDNWP